MINEYLNQLRQIYKQKKILFNEKSNNSNIKLSILICSLIQRKQNLIKLLNSFVSQLSDEVQILVHSDNRQMTTGEKRNILMSNCSGQFLCFFDDDDRCSNTYCKQVLQALYKASNCDCASLQGRISINGSVPRKFIHDLSCGKKWYQTGKGDSTTYFRGPNHLNAIRSSIARQVGYKHITYGEDKDFAQRVFSKLKKSAKVKGVLYYYDYFEKK